jgi:hypothetical protein
MAFYRLKNGIFCYATSGVVISLDATTHRMVRSKNSEPYDEASYGSEKNPVGRNKNPVGRNDPSCG